MAEYVRLTQEQVGKYRRDFPLWSQSEWGFYVNRRFDPTRKVNPWVTQLGPVVWQPHEIKALHALFDMDKHDRFPFSEIYWIDTGQTGKSLKNAALCQWFGMHHEFDADIQILANSQEHAKNRVYQALRRSIKANPRGLEFASVEEQYVLFYDTNNKAVPMPKNAATQSGGSPVLRSMDEIWAWNGESDQTLMGEIKETPARNVSLLFVSTYPGYIEDEGPLNSVLNSMFDENDDPKQHTIQVIKGLPLYCYGQTAVWWNHDALRYPWVSQDFIARQAAKPGVSTADTARIWHTRRPQRTETFMPMDLWDACEDETLEPLDSSDHDVPMVIGVDIGIKNDTSAVVARGYDPVTGKYPLLVHRIFRPDEFWKMGRDPVKAVRQMIVDLHDRHNVLGVYFDSSQFLSTADDLKRYGVKMNEVSQNNDRTLADTEYRQLIMGKELRNYQQSQDLRNHVLHAVGVNTGRGAIRIEKRKATQHIDGAVADSQACYGVRLHKRDFERMAHRKRKLPVHVPQASPYVRTFWGDNG